MSKTGALPVCRDLFHQWELPCTYLIHFFYSPFGFSSFGTATTSAPIADRSCKAKEKL